MYTGVVKFFKEENNYGFITPHDGGKDVFFHGSQTKTKIKTNDVVTFEVADGKKGPEAVNVDIWKDDYEDAE